MIRERFLYNKSLQKFQKFKAFKRDFVLGFCAEILSHSLKCFSKLSDFHFLLPLTTLELQSYSLFYKDFVREENFSKESSWSFDHQERTCT